MIEVINLKNKSGNLDIHYVGRPSTLGNPFRVGVDGSRYEVIRKYKKYLRIKIGSADLQTIIEIEKLRDKALKGDLLLGCWCSPLPCHADFIKKILEWNCKKDYSKRIRKSGWTVIPRRG